MSADPKVAGSIRPRGADAPPPDAPPTSAGLPEEGAPAWTTTFGDLMSLLLTFFILLYSMSELKMERFLLASQSLSQALSGTAVEVPVEPTGPTPEGDDPLNPAEGVAGLTPLEMQILSAADADLEAIARQLETFIHQNGLGETLSVVRSEEGVHLRILSSALFPSGSGVMHPGSRWILSYLAQITGSLDVRAVVSGHTDDEPIQTPQFPSNWELSAARAAGVARELVASGHDAEFLRVEAWGEYRPIADNTTAEGRGQNRRVEILFSREDVLATARRRLQP